MDAHRELCLKNTVVAGNVQGHNVDILLLLKRFGDFEQHAFLINAADVDGCFKERRMDVPVDGDDVIAEVALELHGLFAVALVNKELVLVFVDKA